MSVRGCHVGKVPVGIGGARRVYMTRCLVLDSWLLGLMVALVLLVYGMVGVRRILLTGRARVMLKMTLTNVFRSMVCLILVRLCVNWCLLL